MNLKIDIAKGGSWAYAFGKSGVFGPVLSKGLEEQQGEFFDEGNLLLINLASNQCEHTVTLNLLVKDILGKLISLTHSFIHSFLLSYWQTKYL